MRLNHVYAVVLLSLVAFSSAHADLIVLPEDFELVEGNAYEETALGVQANRIQVVFGESELTGLSMGDVITGLTFRIDDAANSSLGTRTFSNYQILLGQSLNVPGSLSTTFSDNWGADVGAVRNGPLFIGANDWTAGGSPNAFGPTIDFQLGYTYTGGPLLLEYAHNGISGGSGRRVDTEGSNTGLDAQTIVGSGFFAGIANLQNNLNSAPIVQFEFTPRPTAFEWDGFIGDLWDDQSGPVSTNWTPELIPGTGDKVIFGGIPANNDLTLDLNGDRAVSEVEFDRAQGYLIEGTFAAGVDTLTIETGNITVLDGNHTIDGSVNVALAAEGLWNVANSGDSLTVGGAISGSVELDKRGGGTLTLTGNSVYGGQTRVGGGTLIATGADERIPDTSALRIDTAAAFRVDGITETVEGIRAFDGSVFLDNAATLQLMPASPRSFTGTITGAADTTLAVIGGGRQRLDVANPGFLGTTRITGGKMQLLHVDALENSTVDIRVDDGLDILTHAVNANLGALAGNRDLDIGALSLTVGGNDAGTIYSGDLSGNAGGSLTKIGAGTFTLRGNNTYTGDTNIDAGVILLDRGNANAIPDTSPVRIQPGATLRLDGVTERIEGLKSTAGAVDLDNGATLELSPTGSRGFPGTIDGDAATTLAKIGSNVQRLNSANPGFFGTTRITGGSIRLNDVDALVNSTVDIQVDGGLDVTGVDANLGGLDGTGDLGIGSRVIRSGGNDRDTVYSGDMTGDVSSSFVHEGAGTLELAGTGTSIGTLSANGGEIDLNGAGVTLTATDRAAFRALDGDLTMRNGATMLLPSVATSASTLGRGLVDGASLARLTGAGTTLTASRFDIGVSAGSDASVRVESDASLDVTLGTDPILRIGESGTSKGELIASAGGDIDASRIIVGGLAGSEGALTADGAGATLLSDVIALGGLDASERGGSGLLQISSSASATVSDRIRFLSSQSSLLIDSATLAVDEFDEHTGVTGFIAIRDPGGGSALTVGGGDGSSVFNGRVTDAGNPPGSLTKTGTGTLTLNGDNTYSGGTIVDGGTLALGHANAAGFGPIAILGSTIDYADGIDVDNDIDLQNDATLNVTTGSATQSGIILETNGPHGIIKTGGGDLVLAASNTFSGTTDISAGRIVVMDALALQNSTVSIDVDNELDVMTHPVDATIGAIEGSGNLDVGTRVITLGGNGASTVYWGVLVGSGGSVSKMGVGSLTLQAVNTYSGTVNINDGSIIVDNVDALANAEVVINTDGGLDLLTHSTDAAVGSLQVNARLDLAPQTLTVSSTTMVNAGGSIHVGDGRLRARGGVTITDGSFDIDAGDLDGRGTDSQAGRRVTLAGTGALDVDSGGLINLTGGNGQSSGTIGLPGGNGGRFEMTGGTFDLRAGSTLIARGGNGGSATLAGANGNAGSVSVSGGTSILAGTIDLVGRDGKGASGAGVSGKDGGDVTVSGSADVTFSGAIDLHGGDLVPGMFSGPSPGRGGNLNIEGGALTFADVAAVLNVTSGDNGSGESGSVTVSGGVLSLGAGLIDGRSDLVAASTDPVTLNRAPIIVSGNGSLRVNADMTSEGGRIELVDGTDLNASGMADLDGNALTLTEGAVLHTTGGSLINLGGGAGTSGSPGGEDGGRFEMSGGTFDLVAGAELNSLGGQRLRRQQWKRRIGRAE
ncbi:MAG: hypothetical protein CMJ18_05755 [Phycisphaeraceae bacterium]|nr:hypothetical protein [Phycisphaeraceae bacterium]